MTSSSNHGDATYIERELKVPVSDLQPVRSRLRAAGARLVAEAQPEHNTLFDGSDHRLMQQGTALRLRQFGGRWIVTFKGPASYRGNVKQREELELDVSDGQLFVAVLGRLGLVPVIRYEKVREMWRHAGILVCLDHTPLGDFVELEGPVQELHAAVLSLGLDPSDAVRGSYLGLWETYRRQHPERSVPRDMLFST